MGQSAGPPVGGGPGPAAPLTTSGAGPGESWSYPAWVTPLHANNPTMSGRFHHALLQQLLWLLLIVVGLAVAWNGVRTTQYRRWVAARRVRRGFPTARGGPEAAGRRVLRVGFGVPLDVRRHPPGAASMPLGMTPG